MPTAAPTAHISTEALAAECGLKPNTIRVRLCRTGSYFGLRPIKLPNGRLLWPADAVAQLASPKAAEKAV